MQSTPSPNRRPLTVVVSFVALTLSVLLVACYPDRVSGLRELSTGLPPSSAHRLFRLLSEEEIVSLIRRADPAVVRQVSLASGTTAVGFQSRQTHAGVIDLQPLYSVAAAPESLISYAQAKIDSRTSAYHLAESRASGNGGVRVIADGWVRIGYEEPVDFADRCDMRVWPTSCRLGSSHRVDCDARGGSEILQVASHEARWPSGAYAEHLTTRGDKCSPSSSGGDGGDGGDGSDGDEDTSSGSGGTTVCKEVDYYVWNGSGWDYDGRGTECW